MANGLCYFPRHMNIRVLVCPFDLLSSSSNSQEIACALQNKRRRMKRGKKEAEGI